MTRRPDVARLSAASSAVARLPAAAARLPTAVVGALVAASIGKRVCIGVRPQVWRGRRKVGRAHWRAITIDKPTTLNHWLLHATPEYFAHASPGGSYDILRSRCGGRHRIRVSVPPTQTLGSCLRSPLDLTVTCWRRACLVWPLVILRLDALKRRRRRRKRMRRRSYWRQWWQRRQLRWCRQGRSNRLLANRP